MRHRSALCHVCSTTCNTVVQKTWDSRGISVDAKISDNQRCSGVICHSICGTAVCNEVVAHHMQRCFRRIGADAFCSNPVVCTGDYDRGLWLLWMKHPLRADVANQCLFEVTEAHSSICGKCIFNLLRKLSINRMDGGKCFTQQTHNIVLL